MTKADLVEQIANEAEISKATAEKSIQALITSIKKTLKKGGKVTLVGFGTFSLSKRKARKGRNPKTGETIDIKASKTAKFTAGKSLKDYLN